MNRLWNILKGILLLPVVLVLIFLDPPLSKITRGIGYYSYWAEVKKNCKRVYRFYRHEMWEE